MAPLDMPTAEAFAPVELALLAAGAMLLSEQDSN